MLKRLDPFKTALCHVKGNTVLEAVTALHRGRRTAFDNVFSTASESYFIEARTSKVLYQSRNDRPGKAQSGKAQSGKATVRLKESDELKFPVMTLPISEAKVVINYLSKTMYKRFSHTVFSANKNNAVGNVIVTFDCAANQVVFTGLSDCKYAEIKAILQRFNNTVATKVPDHLKPLSAKAVEQYKAYHSGSPEVRLATMLSAIATNLGLGSAEVVEAFLIHLLRAPAKDMPPTIKQGSTEVSNLLFGSNRARLVDYGNGKDKFLNSTTLLNILGFMFAYGIMDNRHGAKVDVIRLMFPNLTISPNDAKAEFKQNCIAAHRTEINRICSTDKDGKIDLEAEGKYFFTTAMHEALKFYCRLYQPGK